MVAKLETKIVATIYVYYYYLLYATHQCVETLYISLYFINPL